MGIIRVVKKALIALTTILLLLSIGLYLYAQLTGPLGPIPGGSLTGTHIEKKPIWRDTRVLPFGTVSLSSAVPFQ